MTVRREPLDRSSANRSGESVIHRCFEVSVSLLGLLLMSPILIVVAALVKFSSPGPVLFRQLRVGLHGKPFEILKFRTMRLDAELFGGQLTVGDDPRVTPIGRFLRKWKLDEFPQLINVVKGDMSLVGPRPEVPRYVALYTPQQRKVLEVRPGITDPASVVFRSESSLMGQQTDPEQYYMEVIMPEKLRLNVEYLSRRSALSDIGVVLRTLRAVVGSGGES